MPPDSIWSVLEGSWKEDSLDSCWLRERPWAAAGAAHRESVGALGGSSGWFSGPFEGRFSKSARAGCEGAGSKRGSVCRGSFDLDGEEGSSSVGDERMPITSAEGEVGEGI